MNHTRLENLLYETRSALRNANKPIESVLWVGSRCGSVSLSWAEFAELASKTNFDTYGDPPQPPLDLVVVGPDWYLERVADQWNTHWEYRQLPQRRAPTVPITDLLLEKPDAWLGSRVPAHILTQEPDTVNQVPQQPAKT